MVKPPGFVPLVDVRIGPPSAASPPPDELPPFQPFEEIWERDARWVMGPALLTDIVLWLRGRSLVAERSVEDPTRVSVSLPLPRVKDDATGRAAGIILAVPPELVDLFLARCSMALDTRAKPAQAALAHLISQKMSPETLAWGNEALRRMEARIKHDGGDELWQVAAHVFGLRWWGLPSAAGLVIGGDDGR